jgi:hypothetical protein
MGTVFGLPDEAFGFPTSFPQQQVIFKNTKLAVILSN